MATVTERPRPTDLVEAHRKVQDPLQRLRKTIRRYVITEALTVLLLCLAACFWVGMLLDYGCFKLFGIDFVQSLPRWFRAFLLGGGVLAVWFVVELRQALRIPPELLRAVSKNRDRALRTVGQATGLLGILLFLGGEWAIRRFRGRWALAFVVVPLLLLYFAAWILLGVLRPSGTTGSLTVGLLVGSLLVALASLAVFKRLFYDFRDAALALVLEKRYPDLLGDRLITAVELADVREAARLGYSPVMVEETIREAARRVDQVPVHEVFDWKRLYIQLGAAVMLTAGVYLLTLFGLMGMAAAREEDSGNSFHDVNEVAAIWFERNVLLDSERWPKRALLQPLNFPKSGELKVGKGQSSVELRALAVEYAIADRSVADRWRAVTLADLRDPDKDLGISDVPENVELPADWKWRNAVRGLTVDEVKLQLQKLDDAKPKGKAAPAPAPIEATGQPQNEAATKVEAARQPQPAQQPDSGVIARLRKVVQQVDERASEPGMSRTLRKLVIPEEVTVHYRGENKRGTVTLDKQANNEYAGKIDDLTESITFDLRAEDYISDARTITVVPPPRVIRLEEDRSEPAYLYYLARTYEDDVRVLAKKKQMRKAIVRTMSGETQPEIRLPSSTDLTLRVVTDKELATVKLDPKGSILLRGVEPVTIDEHTFQVSFKNIRGKMDFRFEFTDTDDVTAVQDVLVMPEEDESPNIQQFKPEVIRQVGDRYMITPEAIIPFSFVVKDDRGLARLEFVYTITEAPSADEEARRYVRAAGGIGLVLSGPQAPLTSQLYNQILPITLRRSDAALEGALPVPHFQSVIAALRRQMSASDIAQALQQEADNNSPRIKKPLREFLGSYVFQGVNELDEYLHNPESDVDDPKVALKGFDVGLIKRVEGGFQLPLKARDSEVQKRYNMALRLRAVDTNIERPGRGVRESKEYPFVIVSDTELLYEIGKEEQRLYDELRKSFDELEKAREQMKGIKFDLPPDAEARVDFLSFSVREENVEKVVREGQRITTKVWLDYERILGEMRTNRIQSTRGVRAPGRELVDKVYNNIVKPLRKIRGTNFVDTQRELDGLRKALDNTAVSDARRLIDSRSFAEYADKEVAKLVEALREVLLQMKGVTDLNELIGKIHRMEQKERELLSILKKLKAINEEDLFKGADK